MPANIFASFAGGDIFPVGKERAVNRLSTRGEGEDCASERPTGLTGGLKWVVSSRPISCSQSMRQWRRKRRSRRKQRGQRSGRRNLRRRRRRNRVAVVAEGLHAASMVEVPRQELADLARFAFGWGGCCVWGTCCGGSIAF